MLTSLSNFAVASSTYYKSSSVSSPEEAAAVMGMTVFIFGFVCCIMLVSFAIQFLIAYFVYADAQKNNVESPMLWAAITFFSWWLGLLLYFFVGKKQNQPVVVVTEPKHHKEHKEHPPVM